jgi:hypothetical protein
MEWLRSRLLIGGLNDRYREPETWGGSENGKGETQEGD